MIDNKKIALIHAVKKECNMSDDDYRELLKESAGVNSSKELDEQGFKKVMQYFAKTVHFKKEKNGITLKQKMFIDSLKKKLKWEKEHFDNYVKKYYHKDNIEEMSKKDGSHLIISLKKIEESQSKKSSNKCNY